MADADNAFVFEVDMQANKHQVRKAVEDVFEVTVENVRIMKVKGKARRFGRHIGRTSDWKKAIVTLAAGGTPSVSLKASSFAGHVFTRGMTNGSQIL